MSTDILAAIGRQISAYLDRRRTLQIIGMGTVAAVISGGVSSLAKDKDKKKKRRRKRRRRKQRNRSSPPTCAEQCPDVFTFCFERGSDSTLCGDTFVTNCRNCTSDQDCIDSPDPYCATGLTLRDTNEAITALTDECGAFADGVCVTIPT